MNLLIDDLVNGGAGPPFDQPVEPIGVPFRDVAGHGWIDRGCDRAVPHGRDLCGVWGDADWEPTDREQADWGDADWE